MITKTACLLLSLSLMIGVEGKHYKDRVAEKSTRYNYDQKTQAETFKITRDTIHVNIDGRLSRALLIHGKYYCFYEVRDPWSSLPIKKFYIISKSGKIEKEVIVPEGINQEYYYKLYFWLGRILVNTEFNKNTYYLNEEKGEFLKSGETITVPLFEDENYRVTSSCHGEFGSKIYFKNKHATGTYSVESGCPALVNKIGDKYFINTSNMPDNDIMEIYAPVTEKVDQASSDILPDTVPGLANRIIFTNNMFNSQFYIATSFVSRGILYLIYNSFHNEFGLDGKEKVIVTKDSVKIGIIKRREFKPLYTFKDKFNTEFQQQLSPGYQICTFHTEQHTQVGFKKDSPPYREAKYGVVEITGNEIKMHYFFSNKAKS